MRSQTRESDSGDALQQKAWVVDEMKSSASDFVSVFSLPKKYRFSRDKLEDLKLSAAQCICNILEKIKNNPASATKVPRPKMTSWKLPHLYGSDSMVGSKLLPLGFQFNEKEPDPMK